MNFALGILKYSNLIVVLVKSYCQSNVLLCWGYFCCKVRDSLQRCSAKGSLAQRAANSVFSNLLFVAPGCVRKSQGQGKMGMLAPVTLAEAVRWEFTHGHLAIRFDELVSVS